MQIRYDDLAGVHRKARGLLHTQEGVTRGILARSGHDGSYRWRAVADEQGNLAFELLSDDVPPKRLASVTALDLMLPSGEFGRLIWDRLN